MREGLSRILHKLGNILLVVWGLFFLIMGATDIGQDRFGVILGFGVGVPLLAVYLLRKRRELRARAQEAAKQPLHGETQREPKELPPEEWPPVTCTQCGAPGRGLTCEYCGSPLPRPGAKGGKRGGRHG